MEKDLGLEVCDFFLALLAKSLDYWLDLLQLKQISFGWENKGSLVNSGKFDIGEGGFSV